MDKKRIPCIKNCYVRNSDLFGIYIFGIGFKVLERFGISLPMTGNHIGTKIMISRNIYCEIKIKMIRTVN